MTQSWSQSGQWVVGGGHQAWVLGTFLLQEPVCIIFEPKVLSLLLNSAVLCVLCLVTSVVSDFL